MDIIVYSKPACVQCTATQRALESKGIQYRYIDLSTDSAAQEHVLSLGYRQAPVVVAGKDHWSGFRPDLINRITQ
ncbi:NrdH-redoxin [Photobacterium jeanii]|uniref:Glutaredoxin-like protein NrdH n=1 Tax=Photobacterium jeanii TaxID=858640 RepID=A0A178K7F6_9GAMM|nr:glutaredoxin-like protein NrdH [Photobacterium jeanii]OAN13278.1 NrdH-redoxin [Photobacterium jeanii]PST90275.1 glutaredoxin-like protein NrdH [Photobacterium jeanii]